VNELLVETKRKQSDSKGRESIYQKIKRFFGQNPPVYDSFHEVVHKKQTEAATNIALENRRKEITEFSEKSKHFGISFACMVSEKPRTTQEVQLAYFIAETVAKNKKIEKKLFLEKKLPVSDIISVVSTRKSFLEKNQAYIIGLWIILTSEYEWLKDYLIEGILH